MHIRLAAVSALVVLALLLAGCAGGKRLAPVSRVDPVADTRPETHTVRKGDTLYAIAWEHGLDYRTLAAWNRLGHPFVIYPGQALRLRGPTLETSDDSPRAEVTSTALPDSAKVAHRELEETRVGGDPPSSLESGNGVSAAQSDRADDDSPVRTWHWPTKGKVIGSFGKSGNKGIHLSGTYEQPVVAAADGRVVYSGTGLVGYGRLIVLKHNKHFFSAYAHNSRILVKEGEIVRGGQRIGLMGSSGSDRVKLHFEIRRNGKPVDPLSYLPRRRT